MEKTNINGKAIYATKGAAREYGRVGCNFYTGCPHGCEYCYLKRGLCSKQLGGNVVKLKKCLKDESDAMDVFRNEVARHADELKKTGVFFSFTTDPMLPETRELTFSAINFLCPIRIPVNVLTKDAEWVDSKFQHCLESFSLMGDDVRIGFTLTGRDDMEPFASRNLDRIQAMRKVKEWYGLRTWASIEPVIDWPSSVRMVECSLEYCDHYKIGLRSGVGKNYYDMLSSARALGKMTQMIFDAGRTVYLKESARKVLDKALPPEEYADLMTRTVDVDFNPYNV